MRQIRLNYWIVTTAIKLSIAAFAFRMLFLQRKKVSQSTRVKLSQNETIKQLRVVIFIMLHDFNTNIKLTVGYLSYKLK